MRAIIKDTFIVGDFNDQIVSQKCDGVECWMVLPRFAPLINAHFKVGARRLLEGIFVPQWVAMILEVFNKEHTAIDAYHYLRRDENRELRNAMVALLMMGASSADVRAPYHANRARTAQALRAHGKSKRSGR